MDIELRKRELREAVRARMRFDAAASAAAQERLAASDLFGKARCGTVPGVPSECGTAVLAALKKTVCYPVMVPGERLLAFRRAAGAFVRGALGVEEPAGEPVELSSVDLLVVPAVAVDLSGRRLGRGRGFYDATLAAYSGVTVALVFESQLVPEVPVGEHDRPVAAVCTEARLLMV